MRQFKPIFVSLILVLLFQHSYANEDVKKLTKNPDNWATWGGNYAGTRYSELNEINAKNVKKLQLVRMFSTGILRGHEGGVLVVDDIIYLHTPFPNTIFALDQKTWSIIWKYTPTQDGDVVIPVMCCDTVNRGLAYAEGKIFLQQADTTLVALNAKTGKLIWGVKNGDAKKGMTNTNAPIVVNNKVITGISGGEFGVRGFLAAYDINDGHLVWKGYSTGADKETLIQAGKTTTWRDGKVRPLAKDESLDSWQGEQWKQGGGTTWGWYTYDPESNLIYYGSGNPGTWNPVQRPGDNKWTSALWARDADTGEVKWVYQMTPHDEWDFDGVNESILSQQIINGKSRQTLVHFDKNGFAYTLDRITGELLNAEKFNPAVNWATHIDKISGRPQRDTKYSPDKNGEDVNTENICPATLGAKNQQPAAYSPKSKLFYIPGNHLCMDYEPFEVEYTAGQPYVGGTLTIYSAGVSLQTGKEYPVGDLRRLHLGSFSAWDATTNKIIWSNSEPFSIWSGALATAGDVVFYGTMEGYLKAVDAKTGKELYRFKTPSGIVGNINTWRYQGRQYIGVLSSIGGWAGIGIEAGICNEDDADTACLNASPSVFSPLSYKTNFGGAFTVFALPETQPNKANVKSQVQVKTNPPEITKQAFQICKELDEGQGLGRVYYVLSSDKCRAYTCIEASSRENYAYLPESGFLLPTTQPSSTFSIDVDSASYSDLRQFLMDFRPPPIDAIRIEEMINYFDYDYPQPKKHPFSVTTELSNAPWQPQHQLLHIGLQGRNIDVKQFSPSNLVFLIDVSSAMFSQLPLIKQSFKLLTQQLTAKDTISIVVYAETASVVLPATNGSKKQEILAALNNLISGDLTAESEGIKLAYDLAEQHFIKEGNNRVILVTDEDFNVGISSDSEWVHLIKEKRKSAILLSVVGFGQSNYQNAQKSNGNNVYVDNILEANYVYVDNILDATKAFVEQLTGTLWTVAKDVKLQLEFNPLKVKSYRLIGYENRHLKHQDFTDDKKDAGELGAGHSVTALYEIIPIDNKLEKSSLKYQSKKTNKAAKQSNDLVTIKLRYKQPDADKSQLLEKVVSSDSQKKLVKTSNDFRFSAAVAEFGLLLRNSEFKGQANNQQVLSLAKQAKAKDRNGYRAEFIKLVEINQLLDKMRDK